MPLIGFSKFLINSDKYLTKSLKKLCNISALLSIGNKKNFSKLLFLLVLLLSINK